MNQTVVNHCHAPVEGGLLEGGQGGEEDAHYAVKLHQLIHRCLIFPFQDPHHSYVQQEDQQQHRYR